MEKLTARILITHIEGAEIAYLYNREAFDLLQINKQQYDGSQFIEKDQELIYDGKKYKVDSINFKMYHQIQEMEHGYGVNMYSPTDPTNFNCQIGVFVRSL